MSHLHFLMFSLLKCQGHPRHAVNVIYVYILHLCVRYLTHGCGRQCLPANKLGGSHPIQEVTELGIRCQTHATVVQTVRSRQRRGSFKARAG